MPGTLSSIGEWWMWAGFFIFALCMLAIDLFVFAGGKVHRISTKEALSWTVLWITLALLFNLLLWKYLLTTQNAMLANEKSLEFLTGYLLEISLSVDNLFVFLVIFNYFVVPLEYQRRVLLYGILGAMIMRLTMILGGIWFISQFSWILTVLGAFLIYSSVKILLLEEEPSLDNNIVLNYLKKHLRITNNFHQEQFIVSINQVWHVTPLFLVLVFIEVGDVIFAVDSVPAIFSVTNDTFIIFTSNMFAIMGLRAFYFLISDLAERFYTIKYGVALILLFIGCKMIIAHWYSIPTVYALLMIVITLLICIIVSLFSKISKKSADKN